MYDHTFSFLRSKLGAPLRTFRYVSSATGNVEDYVWRCGCAARESAGMCGLEACVRHQSLNPVA